MNIPIDLIQRYANRCNISEEYAEELVKDSIRHLVKDNHRDYGEAVDIVKTCIEIIIRTVR